MTTIPLFRHFRSRTDECNIHGKRRQGTNHRVQVSANLFLHPAFLPLEQGTMHTVVQSRVIGDNDRSRTAPATAITNASTAVQPLLTLLLSLQHCYYHLPSILPLQILNSTTTVRRLLLLLLLLLLQIPLPPLLPPMPLLPHYYYYYILCTATTILQLPKTTTWYEAYTPYNINNVILLLVQDTGLALLLLQLLIGLQYSYSTVGGCL